MVLLKKKYLIKIPSSIKFFYCSTTKFLLLNKNKNVLLKKLKVQPIINKEKRYIYITNSVFTKEISQVNCREIEISEIKQLIRQLSSIIFKKLILKGIGYRSILLFKNNKTILQLKLGYSHPIYINIPNNIKILCPNFNNLYITGNSLESINNIISLIRKFRKPEPYKGKGVLYEYEKIILKEGKKV
jgi:large subunit ribosomal protein L6